MDNTLIGIIPGAKAIWRCLRLALLSVAMFSLGASWLLFHATSYRWLTYIAFASIFVNTCYIILMMYATRMSIKAHHTQSVYVLAYILLIMSTTPTLLMLLDVADFDHCVSKCYILATSKRDWKNTKNIRTLYKYKK